MSIGVPVGSAFLYPSSFSLLPIVICDTGSPSFDNFMARVRKDEELSLRTYRSSSRVFADPNFFEWPLPPLCETFPVSFIFLILYLTVDREMPVILCSSFGECIPWFQK